MSDHPTSYSSEHEPSFEVARRTPPMQEPEPNFLPIQDASFRNLFMGFFCVFVAVILFAGAWILLGPQSLLALATAVLVLFLLASLWAFGVHRQRGGLFLSFGLVTIVGALVPLLIGVVLNLPAGQVYLAQMRSFPGQSAPQPNNSGGPVVLVQPVSNQPPLLSDAFSLFANASSQGEQIRILSDSRVELEGKVYLLRAGQMFPMHSRSNDGGVVIRAKDYLVTLPREIAEVVAPMVVATNSLTQPVADASPAVNKAELINKSQLEAVKRYPALAIKDSEENRIYIDAYNDLKLNKPEFFEDGNWPLKLAEQLGTAYAWQDLTKPESQRARPPVIEEPMGLTEEEPDAPPLNIESDTIYLKEPAPGAPPVLEEKFDDVMIDDQGGRAEATGTEDLSGAPPMEITP